MSIATLAAPILAPELDNRDRSRFLGGSDAAAVMGLSPWHTPLELWQQKTGRTPPRAPDPDQQRRFNRGKKLEPFIVEMAVDKLVDMGLDVELLAVNQRYRDAEHPFLACEIDMELRITGTVVIGDTEVVMQGEHINGDAKSVSGFARKKWGQEDTEDVPIEYAAQFMHGLGVTGRRYCLVAALRSFDDVDIYWTVRDEETIAAMRQKMVEFWQNCVLADVPPDPIKFSDIKALFPLDDGSAIEATQEVADLVARYAEAKRMQKTGEDHAEELQFRIAEYMRPHARLTFEGRDLLTWKAQSTTRLDGNALEAAHPELVAQFKNTTAVRVMRLASKKAAK